jgi:ABC-2 type transport system ATP-binding protein
VSADRRIVFEDVSKFYGEVLGVNRVTLSLPPGITSLVGPNGSGKTTLMNLMTGLIRPTRGRLSVLGLAGDDSVALGRRVGYCTQFDSFPRGVTGRSFVRGWLGLHGLAAQEADRLTAEALDRVGMTEAADRKVAAYSKGMRQRIRLALALSHRPEVLVLDEPLNGLDVETVAHVKEMMRRRARQGRTIFYSSHLIDIVEKVCTRIAVIHAGQLVSVGTVGEVVAAAGAASLEQALLALSGSAVSA